MNRSSSVARQDRCATAKDRLHLFDWLFSLVKYFDLSYQSLHLSIELVHRQFATQVILLSDLQLIGAASLLIASKYHDDSGPNARDMCIVCDDRYTCKQMVMAERRVLEQVDYCLSIPTAYSRILSGRNDISLDQFSCVNAICFMASCIWPYSPQIEHEIEQYVFATSRNANSIVTRVLHTFTKYKKYRSLVDQVVRA